MRLRILNLPNVALTLVACLGTLAGVWIYESQSRVLAEDESGPPDNQEAKSPEVQKKKRHRTTQHKAAAPKPTDATHAARSEVAVATPAPAPKAPEGNPPTPVDFAAQLDKAGASTCRNQMNALAASTMGSVEKFNTVSNWSMVDGDKRAVSLAIGQKYATGSAVPYGLSQVVAAPNRQGGCDGFTVQVFPSPLSCAKLRDSIVAQHGQQIGDLAGIPLMQDAAGRTMLVPTGADTCVLVATRTVYPK